MRSVTPFTAMASKVQAALVGLLEGDVLPTLTFSQARRLSAELLARGVVTWPAEVRDWSIGTVRDSLLWCESWDRAALGGRRFRHLRSSSRVARTSADAGGAAAPTTTPASTLGRGARAGGSPRTCVRSAGGRLQSRRYPSPHIEQSEV